MNNLSNEAKDNVSRIDPNMTDEEIVKEVRKQNIYVLAYTRVRDELNKLATATN